MLQHKLQLHIPSYVIIRKRVDQRITTDGSIYYELVVVYPKI